MLSFSELKKNLKKVVTGTKEIKIALLGDSATQLLGTAIKGMAIEYNVPVNLWEGDYDQIDRQIFDESSELYSFSPDYVIIFKSYKKNQKVFYNADLAKRPAYYESFLAKTESEYLQLKDKLKCRVIYFNFPETDDGIFGNYANKTAYSFLYQLRKINTGLMELGQKQSDLFICDIASLYNRKGKDFAHNAAIYINTDLLFSIDFLPSVAKNVLDMMVALRGRISKCVVLDLDNTMWGGIIGDDGVENIQIGELGIGKAFSEFQRWIKQLKERGIILAVCSKNDEANAKEPFANHPEMILRLADIAVFVANWEPKPDNIRYIQRVLNIGFDSMVFLDDNPFERNFVKESIPEIIVPELPPNPEDYVSFLQDLNLFETVSFSLNDTERTDQYRTEAERASFAKVFTNEDDFLHSLEMTSEVRAFNKFTIPRVAQLTQRSNQFNLRTVRYSEGEIEKISNDNNFFTFTFTLKDKFGDNGLISLVILRKESAEALFIDTWIMSCRVLKRGMENFVLNEIVATAGQQGFKYVCGEYIPTTKNGMVRMHYQELGFKQEDDGRWLLPVKETAEKKSYIKKQ